MELQEAVSQIAEIRQQIARATVFRGYRSLPVAFSGFLALFVACVQGVLIPEPKAAIGLYLSIWVATAVVSFAAAGLEMAYRLWRTDSPLQRDLTLLALEQFLPSLVAGSMLTAAIVRVSPEQVWMLPGLWAVVYSLGVFASYRLLPSAVFWVASYYLVAGGCCLLFGQGENALAPWTMALTFGAGQLFAAAILYWNLERRHAGVE